MPIELDTERTSKLVAEIVTKSSEKKISWTATDQAYSATVGPLSIFIFRNQQSFGWNSMHAALDGKPILSVMNTEVPGISKSIEMTGVQYRRNVDEINKLVQKFDSEIRETQFAKALDAISSL